MWDKVRSKIDKVAESYALMERGEFIWEDGKQRWSKVDGKSVPRVVKKDAVISAGYKGTPSVMARIFSEDGEWHAYFLERLRWHRQRLSGEYQQAIKEITRDGTDLEMIASKLFDSLMYNLSDPEFAKEIPFQVRLKGFADLVKQIGAKQPSTAEETPEKEGLDSSTLPPDVRDQIRQRQEEMRATDAE